MKTTTAMMAALLAATGAGALAGPPVVVELYTSQGCSSCPPADAYLAELAGRPDVIALSLHVDYWDYLGWRDAFAAPEHAKRQKRLAKLRGERMIYTPQMVIDGVVAVVGSDRAAVEAAVSAAMSRRDVVEVRLVPDGEMLRAEARAAEPVDVDVVYMIYDHPQEVVIERGENEGASVAYVNTVRALMPLGEWRGGVARWLLPAPPDARGAALVIQAKNGEVLGAASHEIAGR